MLSSVKILFCFLVLFLASSRTLAQEPPAQTTEDSCRKFVQQFYDWYLPRARKANERAGDIVLKYRSRSFSVELRRRLKEDSDAQAKSEDLVGLDFDPFLNTQDPGFERCTVGKIVRKNAGYWAEVTCVFPGADASKSQIMPELVFHQGRWIFTNFHYHEGSKEFDLLGLLKDLRKERQK